MKLLSRIMSALAKQECAERCNVLKAPDENFFLEVAKFHRPVLNIEVDKGLIKGTGRRANPLHQSALLGRCRSWGASSYAHPVITLTAMGKLALTNQSKTNWSQRTGAFTNLVKRPLR